MLNKLLKVFFSVSEKKYSDIKELKSVLIVKQHNQMGDMLVTVPLFRAIKEKYPLCRITLITSPQNKNAVLKNKYVDESFCFDKSKLTNLKYLKELRNILRREYDISLIPSFVSLSLTSDILARLSNSQFIIGAGSLDGEINRNSYMLHIKPNLDWRAHPDTSNYEKSYELVKPLGLVPSCLDSEISYDADDIETANRFLATLPIKQGNLIIGMHCGAGKPQNRWSPDYYKELIYELRKLYNPIIYFTASCFDMDIINYINQNLDKKVEIYLDKNIPQMAALIAKTDLFISNDTGIMHIAGATPTPLISIFGQTNPFNWSPVGSKNYFLRKSDLINDVTPNDVLHLIQKVLNK